MTALLMAVASRNLESVRIILGSASVEIDKSNADGVSALMWASRAGFTEIGKLLLDHKANVNGVNKWV